MPVHTNRGRAEKPESSGVIGCLHVHEPYVRVDAEFCRDSFDKLPCGLVVRTALKEQDLYDGGVRHGSSVAPSPAVLCARNEPVRLHLERFVWEKGKMTRLPVLPGCTGSGAGDINDEGQIVGSCRVGIHDHAVLWTLRSG